MPFTLEGEDKRAIAMESLENLKISVMKSLFRRMINLMENLALPIWMLTSATNMQRCLKDRRVIKNKPS